ncbi:MAG TPA: hypothetical protein VFT45_26320 [Longimicrobium sp.]|nr:hypothetical protein [Longimicrobium sp.]
MYRSCIFCSAPLGSNDSIERFPVGRSLAFDTEKGRLWAVCGQCARWNLAPIEERWEAIESAERLFRDTRLRVQSENVGLAKLPDGTQLVRVGAALAGELAAWRYGREFLRRHRGWMALEVTALLIGIPPGLIDRMMNDRTIREHRVPASLSPTGRALVGPVGALQEGHLDRGDDGALLFRIPLHDPLRSDAYAEFRDDAARAVLARALPLLNRHGGSKREVRTAVEVLAQAPSAEAYIRTIARDRGVLGGERAERTRKLTPTGLRALEMALHEEQERRALDGELAALEAMWRQAEEIAAIADRLPDVDAEPPRLPAER